jgi:hypothetical protein
MKIRCRAARLALLVTLVSSAASCQCKTPPESALFTANPAPVTHLVFVWLKTPGDERARQRIIEASQTFVSIPGVHSVTTGNALPSTRPIVDSSYDVAIIMRFGDEAALRAYDQHPTHKKAVEEVLKPLAAKVQIYDITSGLTIQRRGRCGRRSN